MPLLLETIKIDEGRVYHLPYHQARCDKSREALFGTKRHLALSSFIKAPKKGLYRCRIVYGEKIQTVEYIPYRAKKINSLKIVSSNLEYDHKYANREALNKLLTLNSSADEILIEKNGYITDTSIANIAFYDNKQWFTPKTPLLKGTTRARLLDEGFLQLRDIRKDQIANYTQVALMNAMIGFKILNQFTYK
ncbi:MAG: aminotransferase class IV family protein [Campylobacterota bacterium]|nr:aminotransferase class IV family protein [Campylobacterota bacterium]